MYLTGAQSAIVKWQAYHMYIYTSHVMCRNTYCGYRVCLYMYIHAVSTHYRQVYHTHMPRSTCTCTCMYMYMLCGVVLVCTLSLHDPNWDARAAWANVSQLGSCDYFVGSFGPTHPSHLVTYSTTSASRYGPLKFRLLSNFQQIHVHVHVCMCGCFH